MALSLLDKAKQYFTSKSQDNEGWFRQGKFTPLQQIGSQINYQKQVSPLNRALYTGLETAAKPVYKSLLNIGALEGTAIGALQNKFGNYQGAQKSFDKANKVRQYTGTQGSFDQGTGWNTIKTGGLDALKTLLTAKGLKYTTPANLGLTGLIGGGLSKMSGGDFATGAGRAMGTTPQIMGAVAMSNPLLAKIMPTKASPIASRLTGGLLNVAQGVGINASQGTPNTPASMGLDLLTGIAGGRNQFNMGTNFSMSKNTMDEIIQAEDMLLHPERYLEQTISVNKKNANAIKKVQIKKIQEEAARIIDQISAKHLPNDILEKTAGNVKAQIKALIDLNSENKLANVNYFAQKDRDKLKQVVDNNIKITDPFNPDTNEINSSIKATDDLFNALLKSPKDKDFLNKVKSLRARLNEQQYKVVGIEPSGHYKTDYAAFQTLGEVPQQSLLDNIQDKITQLDEIIANKGKTSKIELPPIKTGEIKQPTIKIKGPVDTQNGRIDTSVNPPTMNQGTSTQQGRLKVKLGQSQPPSQVTTPKTPEINPLQTQVNNTTKQRGLVSSVQEAPNISGGVKVKVRGSYIPKTNTKLMGEAEALLQDGVTIDFKNTKDLDKKVAATIQEALNQQKAGNNDAAANLYNNLSEHATELGRGVQAFSLLRNMSPESIALSAAGRIKKYNATHSAKIPELTGDQIKIISDKVQAMDLLKGREKNIAMNELEQTINSFIPSSIGDKFLAVWKAGLLTSLRTHERNFVGNAIHGVAEIIKDIPATVADKVMSLKTGQRSTTFTVKGLGEFGSKETGQQMKDIISKGYDPTEQVNKFDHKTITWGKNPLEQILKKYTDTVFRTLGASDKPFYNAAMARSLYDQAGAAAIIAGRRGDAKFIENLVAKPTEEMLKIAINDANIATFKNKNAASEVASVIKRTLSKNELTKIAGEITIPFTGVPSSIFGQIGSYSPIGLLNGIRKTGKVLAGQVPELQREAAKDLGRGVVGTSIFALGSYLMGKGIITGQPKDANEAKQWDLENKPRNSILIGGKWRSLNSIGPEAVVFLAGAKLNEEMNNPEGSLANYGMTLGKDYLDQSFVQGLQAPVNAITDPQRYGKSYVGSLSSSFIPNIVKDASRALDPTARETNNLSLNPFKNDYIKAGIPFVRNTLLPKRDVLGNQMPQEPTGWGAFTDLFNSKTPINNTVVDELSRLYKGGSDATPSKLTPSQTILKQKVKLTYEQLNNLESGIGEVLRPKLEKLISDPNYQKLDDESKTKAIDNLVQDTRKKYKNLNASDYGVSGNGYLDSSGNYKTIDTATIPKPNYTGNATIDKKLKTQYENAIAKQQTEVAKSQLPTTPSDEKQIYSYVDEYGNYKTVDLTPVEYPTLTGNDVVDKKLKSSYYSAINSQINDVIKLGQSGQITEDEMIQMVNALSEQYKKGKSTKSKGGKITIAKVSTPTIKKFKLPTIKLPNTSLKSNIKVKKPSIAQLKKRRTIKIKV